MSQSTGRQKVAVLGSGVGAMVAAFELTHPDHDGASKYDVTVYQMGWRLGGKGACGRNLDWHNTIEEHGLHIWLGFYCNAFSALKSCYDELNRPPGTPLARIGDALKPQSFITFMDDYGGKWSRWDLAFEPVPGDPWDATPPSAWAHAQMLLAWMVNTLGRETPAPHDWVQKIVERVRLAEEDLVAGFTNLHIALSMMESLGEAAMHASTPQHDVVERALEQFADEAPAGHRRPSLRRRRYRAADGAVVRPLRVEPARAVPGRGAPRPADLLGPRRDGAARVPAEARMSSRESRQPGADRVLRHRVRVRGRHQRRSASQHRRGHGGARDAQDVLWLQGRLHVEDAGGHGGHDLRADVSGPQEAGRDLQVLPQGQVARAVGRRPQRSGASGSPVRSMSSEARSIGRSSTSR